MNKKAFNFSDKENHFIASAKKKRYASSKKKFLNIIIHSYKRYQIIIFIFGPLYHEYSVVVK